MAQELHINPAQVGAPTLGIVQKPEEKKPEEQKDASVEKANEEKKPE